jgi:hypothetical protein
MTYDPGTELQSAQSIFLQDMYHVIEVTTYSGKDAYGKRQLSTDPAETRQYNCLIQVNERTSWNITSDTDDLPYMAYVMTIPIGGTVPYPIRVEEQVSVVTYADPNLEGVVRRMGRIQSYPDQYGNLFTQTFTFE